MDEGAFGLSFVDGFTFRRRANSNRMKPPLSALARVSATVVCLGVAVSAAGAAEGATGSVVVRLLTDPAPAGVAWSYSGVGQAFQLRASGSAKTISGLADGTYQLT